jgi:hypothetical protein
MSKAGERLIGAAKEAVLLARQLAEAEARGYRRGVEDAARVTKSFGDAQDVACEILHLLEQTSDSNSPHLDTVRGVQKKD